MEKYKLFKLLFIFIYINFSQSYIILPIHNNLFEQYFNVETDEERILLLSNMQYYTNIKIGTPSKKIPLTLDISLQIFNLSSNNPSNLKSEYIPEKSSSLNVSSSIENLSFNYSAYLSSDIIHLIKHEGNFLDISPKYTEYNEIYFYFSNYNKNKEFIGSIGLTTDSYLDLKKDTNFIKQLYNNKYIKLPTFNIRSNINNFTDKLLFIGELPNIFDESNFSNDKYKLITISANDWKIDYEQIDYISNDGKKITMDYEEGIIIDFTQFFSTFPNDLGFTYHVNYFKSKISQNICFTKVIEENDEKNTYYYCDKKMFNNSMIEEVPSLYFTFKDNNFTFSLNYHELFYTIGDIIYFTIRFTNSEIITLGESFTQKYHSVFNVEEDTISLYVPINNYDIYKEELEFINVEELADEQEKEGKKESGSNFYIVVILIIFVLILVFWLIIRNRRKKNTIQEFIEKDNKKDIFKNSNYISLT